MAVSTMGGARKGAALLFRKEPSVGPSAGFMVSTRLSRGDCGTPPFESARFTAAANSRGLHRSSCSACIDCMETEIG